MNSTLIDPRDSLERQNEKLLLIAQSLMQRVEQKTEQSGFAYQQFERAALLESQVRERTRDLERTLDLLQDSNARLEIVSTEREIARSNLTEAIEAIDDGFALFDPEDKLVLFNSRFCQDLIDVETKLFEGLSFKEYVNMISQSETLSLPVEQTPSDWVADRLAHHGDDHVAYKISLSGQRWVQISEHRTDRGATVVLQTDVSDIVYLERQERARLRDRQAKTLQATLDHLNQGVCIFNRHQVLVGWNKNMNLLLNLPDRRKATEYKFGSLLDHLSSELEFQRKFSAEKFSNWANKTTKRKPIFFEVTRKPDQIFSIFCQEMPDRGFVISITDVTAERAAAHVLSQMNEQLELRVEERTRELGIALAEAERANASKSRFVAAASHDLLQPLSAAKLFLSSLAENSDAASHEIIGKTETALQAVEQIIEALLDISKLDAGKAVFDVKPVRLSEIFEPLYNELSLTAAEKGIHLSLIDSSLIVVSDPAYLRRILQNLLTNAIRYTEKGRVVFGVRRNGTSARIEIWDTGSGIAEQDHHLIFQEFKQIGTSQKNTGLGLGLAIVERACAGLEHQLGLWSELGTGSCFSLNVPISNKALLAPETEHETQETEGNISGLVVILVENESRLRTAMAKILTGLGVEVLAASDANQALEIIEEIDLIPDAFLLDYRLGSGQTGTELYEYISTTHHPVPTAIISADRTSELRAECKRLGINFLPKPINTTQLRSFLDSLNVLRT
ncbi:signal transduction histidine kinase [Rhodobacterales bacterium HTCC2150]|nr:signal transduction histidine kinase [Rhodobacterales bacterium HTCC2150] [Rhodobacteraceae bacterium HTCC2150]